MRTKVSGRQPEDVRVGIVSWNVAPLLDRCLAALPSALKGLRATVVVVDNASDDDSVAVARRHPGVDVVANRENVGYACGMNQALSGSGAGVLIALNPDTEPAPGSLVDLVDRLRAADDVGLVVPRLVYPDGTTQHSVYRFPSPSVAAVVSFVPRRWLGGDLGARWWLEGFAPHDHPTDVDWAIGAVHVIRANALAGSPPYNERSFMYAEDLELCWRLAESGWRRRLEADIAVVHVGNASGEQAWGDARVARWLEATYGWYAEAKGRGATTWWGVINVIGLFWLVGSRLVRAAVRPTDSVRLRREAHDYARHLRLHLRFIRGQLRR